MGKVTCKMDSRLSVMLQIPHCILSHKKERLHALLCDSELHVWKWIVFAYHSCMIVFFFFFGQVFASWKALLIFSDLQEFVLSPGNADITALLHKIALGMALCVFPKCTQHLAQLYIPRCSNCNQLTGCSEYSEYAREDPCIGDWEVILYWIFSLVIWFQSKTILKIFLTF